MGNNSSVVGTRQKEPLVHEIVGLIMKNESSLQSDINGFTIGCVAGGGLSTACAYYGRKSLFGISPLNSVQTRQGRLLKLFGSVGVCGFSMLFSNNIYKRQHDYTKACTIANVIKPLLVTDKNDYKVIYQNPQQGTLLFHDNKFSFHKVKNPIQLKGDIFSNYVLSILNISIVCDSVIPYNKRLLITTKSPQELNIQIDDEDRIEMMESDQSRKNNESDVKLTDEKKNEPTDEKKNEPNEPNTKLEIEPDKEIDSTKSSPHEKLYYGIYSRPVLTDGSTQIDGSVSLQGDIITIDGYDSHYLQLLVSQIFKLYDITKDSPINIFEKMHHAILPYLIPLNIYNYKSYKDVTIDQMMLNGSGVCRHYTLIYGYLIEQAIKKRYLDGTFKYKKGYNRSFINKGAHVWIEYVDKSGEIYIIDGAQNIISNIDHIGTTSKREKNLKDIYYSK